MSVPSLLRAAESVATAPSFAVSVHDVYGGLPHHGAQVLEQTSDGYLWIGTESGLARFDGVRFVTYRTVNTPELPANLIRSLFEDREGWLWIATQAGLCRYRGGKFERVGLIGRRVSNLAQDRAGRLWVATQDDGLFEFREGQLISRAHEPGLGDHKDVSHVFVDSRDRLWVNFRNSGLFYRENGAFRRFDPAPYQFRTFGPMAESPDGSLWIGGEKNGVLRVRDGNVRLYGAAEGLGLDLLRNVFIDHRGQVWVVTNNLYVLPTVDSPQFIRVPLPVVENCRNIIEDREGSYWVGSAGDGVVRMRPSGFSMLSRDDGVLGGNTRTVALDRDGTLWAGLASSGAARVDPSGNTKLIETGTGAGSEVWSILPASDGRVWIGTRGDLRRRQGDKEEIFPQFVRVRALFEDSRGDVWIGSENQGVTRYRNGEFTSLVADIKARQKISHAPIAMAFGEAADGTFYIGLRENGGLVTIKDGTITVDQDLPSNDLRAIYPDRDGNLWVGSKGRGLLLRRDGRWLNPELFSEPFNDQVSSVLEDAAGRLWLGTPKGIVWKPKSQLLAIVAGDRSAGGFRIASAGDGVRQGTVGAGSFPHAVQAPDGRMWFATRRGIVTVDPKKITFNEVVPPVHVERVLVDNKLSTAGEMIQLRAGTRSLAIEYTALSFVGPSQVLFRYRLEGRDQDWVEAGTRRTALYADLPPGTYRFHVIACNDDGVWNETGASVQIVQLPFFYQTRWFYIGMAVGLLGAGLGIFRWRTASLRRRNQELQARIAERTAELAKSYEAIRASEYFYHSLVESLPQIIVRKDTAGRFTYANAAFGELVGRPLDSIIGRTDAELFPAEEAQKSRADDLRVMGAGQPLEYEIVVEQGGKKRFLHVKKVPLCDENRRSLGVQILFWDTTSFREIEDKLKQAQRELVDTSRLAGIAEMATGILHNLGNALNSVNTTANLATARMRESRISSVGKVADLLAKQNGSLPEFFAKDPRGQQLPAYIATLAEHLTRERREILDELQALQANVDHIKELVAAQQQYARVSGIVDVLPASELVEIALRISESSLTRHNIRVVREVMPAPRVKVERQKALQIIGNLLNNARDSLKECERSDRQIVLGVRVSSEGRTQIYVTDNGLGITQENLTRIFNFGFTTKKQGHGFGLHSSALAAKELGGSLSAASDGPGKGATFILELPGAD